jgi:hypothetical protein
MSLFDLPEMVLMPDEPRLSLGLVGAEAAKFTKQTKIRACELIEGLLRAAVLLDPQAEVVSGGCHLGGVDIWSEEIARDLRWPEHRIIRFAPAGQSWAFYRARNIKIAKRCTKACCVTVKTLPPDFRAVGPDGRLLPGPGGWEFYCYHCQSREHIKSGGCWTVKYAKGLGKPGDVLVVE